MKAPLPTYRLPNANWSLEFSESALWSLTQQVQRSRWRKESVGQLFTRDLTSDCVVVERATVLVPTWAAWARVRFDTKRAMAERETLFSAGFHCIGLWHTHPEPIPSPSTEDRRLAREHALAAKPQLAGLVFVIVGTAAAPVGLRVWVDDGKELHEAEGLFPAGKTGDPS